MVYGHKTPSDPGGNCVVYRVASVRFMESHAETIVSGIKTPEIIVKSKDKGSQKRFKNQCEAGGCTAVCYHGVSKNFSTPRD